MNREGGRGREGEREGVRRLSRVGRLTEPGEAAVGAWRQAMPCISFCYLAGAGLILLRGQWSR